MTVSKHSTPLSTKRTANKRSRALLGFKAQAVVVDTPSSPSTSNSSNDTSGNTGMKRIVSYECRSETVVSFQETVQVFKVQPVDESLKNELFYSKTDYRRFKQESKRISSLLDQRLSCGGTVSSRTTQVSSSTLHRVPSSSKNARFSAQKPKSLAALRQLLLR